MSVPALEALERLKQGNRRFVSGSVSHSGLDRQTRRAELASEQFPFAIILGCSDSRVPAEMVFDQGLGDLFVIRVAGNIVAPSQVGSVEFAAARFDTRLVVVLGHSRCGAIEATLEELRKPSHETSGNQRSIVNRILPSVEGLLAGNPRLEADALLDLAVRENVKQSVDQLRHGSEIIEQLVREEGLLVVGAEYSLDTGVVEFFAGSSGALSGSVRRREALE